MGNAPLLADFEHFLAAPQLLQIDLPRMVYERATHIRAQHRFKLGDSLHLAAAVEGGCQRFLTNDTRLNVFTDLAVEVLP